MSELIQAAEEVERLQKELEKLAVRGLRLAGPEQLAPLRALAAELERQNAVFLAARLGEFLHALQEDSPSSAGKLFSLRSALGLMERLLSRDVAVHELEALCAGTASDEN